MGLCASSNTTATASVSPHRNKKAKPSNESATLATSYSGAASGGPGGGSDLSQMTGRGRAIALKKVGENSFMSNLVQAHSGSITADYIIDSGAPLGTGMSCVVKRITHRHTGKKYALKAVRLNRIEPDKIADLRREIEIMKALDHPNIIKLYQTFEDHSYIYMVMELCTGGELFDRLADQKNAKFTEPKAADLVSKMLSSLNYIHLRRVCHRDLKLENFIFEHPGSDAEIKLIDFGLSKVYMENAANMKAVLGTSYYVAPEVLAGNYGMECDLWGLGVLAFMMLCGQAPFSGDEDPDILKLVKIGKFSFVPKNIWRNISSAAKDFISKLLVVDVKARMTAQEALQHPWMTEHRDQKVLAMDQNENELAEEIYDSLQSYRNFAKLKRAALIAIAYTLNQDDIEASRSQFERLDTSKNGFITLDQLKEILQHHNVPPIEVEKMFNDIDQDHSGTIDYSEFIAAAMQKRVYLDEERLHDAFHRLDVEGTGFLTKEGLTKILGASFTADEVVEMVQEADFKHNGKISFDEFQKLMRDDVPASPAPSGILRKKTGRLSSLDGGTPTKADQLKEANLLLNSPSRPMKRRPSRAFDATDLLAKKLGTPSHLLPCQINDRTKQLGAPSPLMKQGRKVFKKSSAEKLLWEEKKIPEAVGENQ